MEEWRDIIGYEGYYQVSNLGRVKSLPRVVRTDKLFNIKGSIKKSSINTKGYFVTSLRINNKSEVKYLHRLIAETFISNPNNYPQVCHKNDIKTDNTLDNLYWGTPKDNTADCIRNGTFISSNTLLKVEQVKEIRRLLTEGFSCSNISLKFLVNAKTINDIKNNKIWKNIC